MVPQNNSYLEDEYVYLTFLFNNEGNGKLY